MSKDKQLDHDEKIRQMLYFIDFSGITLSEDDKPKLMETAFKSVNILRGQDYLKAHPDLDKRTKEAIQRKKLFL